MRTFKILQFLIFCSIFFFIQTIAQQKQDKFKLKVNLTGFADSTKFYLVNLDSTQYFDSAYLINKELEFNGHVSEPVVFRLYPKPDKNFIYFNIWIENKTISIIGNKAQFSELTVIGSPLNKIDYSVEHQHSHLDKLRDSLATKAMNESDENKAREIWKNISIVDDKVTKIRLNTIATFKPSIVTIKELYFLRNDLTTDSLKLLFNKFPTSLKTTKYGDVITQYILINNLKMGSYAPEITGLTLQGQNAKLSDYKGKVILLDFWASWCGPCRNSNKTLATLFQKYKDKDFEIISFSTDTNLEDWKAASFKDNISWTNISDLKGLYSKQAASYKIRAIPKSFLINKNGAIVEIFTGFGEDTEKSLEKKIIELSK